MRVRAAAAAVVVAFPVTIVTLAAQDIRVPSMPPRFTATIDYVEVDARVLDANGEPIRNLEAKDFRVLEDGVQQAVSVFSFVDLPRPIPDRPGIPAPGVRPDVAVNTAATDKGRTYLLVIDTPSIERSLTLLTRKFLRDFVERSMGPDDRIGLATTGRDRAYENFTSDKARLSAAIGRLFAQSDGSPTVVDAQDITNRALAIAPDPGGSAAGGGFQKSPPVADGLLFDARTSQRDLVQFIQAMSTGNGGSKSIIFVSEGVPYETVSNTEGLKTIGDLERIAGAARRGNVPIYPVDPRGLTSGGEEAILAATTGGKATPGSTILDEVRRSHDRLRALADDSGGTAILDVNDLPRGLERVVSLSSAYYVLGYYATNTKRDGKYHRIKVEVDQPGTKVLARHGYTAPSAKAIKAAPLPGPANASLELRQALNAQLPVDGLTMAATAAAFRGADAGKASVSVVLEAQGTDPDAAVEMAAAAMTPTGAIRDGEFGRVDFSTSPGARDRVTQFGFRWLARLNDLKPGRYQIRGAVSGGSAKQGSVWYDLDVPDFSKLPLSMSDLLLASVVATQRVTVRPDKLLADALPAPATTLREFLPTDTIAIYAEAYDNDAQHPHEVETTVFITNERGEMQSRTAETRTPVNGLLKVQARLPLVALAPGRYTLAVEARQTANRAIAAGRAVPFQVVAGGNR